MLVVLGFFISFTIKSIPIDDFNFITILFFGFGLFGSVYLVDFIIKVIFYLYGTEVIIISEESLIYELRINRTKRRKRVDRKEISEVSIHKINEGNIYQKWSNLFEQIECGIIEIEYRNSRKLKIGQSLSCEELSVVASKVCDNK